VKSNLYSLVINGTMLILGISCANKVEWTKPILTTKEVIEITQYTAVSGGEITDDSGLKISVRGVCWNNEPNHEPTINDDKTEDGSGSESFNSILTDLIPGTTYFVRAYAKNSIGVGYGSTISFTTLEEEDDLIDINGNVYNTVIIDTIKWMAENLKVTQFNDGSAITLVEDNSIWSGLEAAGFCWYNNDQTSYGEKYGALYNWQAVNSGKLCPTGWRIPTNAGWGSLVNFLGGENVAGGKLKATSGWAFDGNGTDDYGFSALPGGSRDGLTGTFQKVDISGYWWSSTENDQIYAWFRRITHNYDIIYKNLASKKSGYSVRCIKDN